MLRIAGDISDPPSEKAALVFLNRSIAIWGQPLSPELNGGGQAGEQRGLPGFDQYIYERVIPTVFRVPSLPEFNLKDPGLTPVSTHRLFCNVTPISLLRFCTKLQIYCKPFSRCEERRPMTISSVFSFRPRAGQPRRLWTLLASSATSMPKRFGNTSPSLCALLGRNRDILCNR
jgi:hypothetical protein